MKELKNKQGTVSIGYNVFKNITQQQLKALFSVFYPFHIESNYMSSNITYSGYSPFFDDVEEGCIAPNYNAILTTNEDGSASVTFEKI